MQLISAKSGKKIKAQSKWVNIVFNDPENPSIAKYFAFAFKTISFHNLLNLQFTLTDDEANNIKFKDSETKALEQNFRIQLLKK